MKLTTTHPVVNPWQILVTGYDFTCADRREHIQYCVNSLLKLVSLASLVWFC